MSNNPYLSNIATPDTQRSLAGPFSGSAQNVGTALTVNPIIAVLDNQSSVAVDLYINAILWKTFSAGEALVLDMRSNHGNASTWTFKLGTQFSVIATGGSGSFYISILYAE